MVTNSDRALGPLELEIVRRIERYRAARKSSIMFCVAMVVAVTALAGGVLTGSADPQRRAAVSGSEAALLDDDIGLAPSSLLASN